MSFFNEGVILLCCYSTITNAGKVTKQVPLCFAKFSFLYFFGLKVSSRVFVKSLLTHTLEMVDCIA